MILSELWHLYETDKRLQGFSPATLKAYTLQLRMLVTALGEYYRDDSESAQGIPI